MALNVIKGTIEDAKRHLMRQALKRFPKGVMLPCGRCKDLEAGFVWEATASIMTFWYNVKGITTTKTEAVRLERRKYDYDCHVPERRKKNLQ